MRYRLPDAAILLAVILGAAISALLGAHYADYHAGSTNAAGGFGPPFFQSLLLAAFGGVLALAALGAGLLRWRRWRWRERIAWMAILLLPIAAWIAGMLAVGGRNGAEQYERGFNHWAATNVDAPAIRAWLAAQAPLPVVPPSATPLAPAAWSPTLTRLRPEDVSLCQTGVIITFGHFGTWGDQRQVFIAADPAAGDPGIFLWGGNWQPIDPGKGANSPWVKVQPGLYAWVQSGG